MYKPLLATAAVLAGVAGCATSAYLTYRDEPLVAQVEEGMSTQQVLGIGGPPAAITERSASRGLCHDYLLGQAGQQQPYSVSFDAAGRVDHKGFQSCAEQERAASEPPTYDGGY
ncbi:MAG: osmotically-inducible lipoprotein OsmE [Pseudomonas sp.]